MAEGKRRKSKLEPYADKIGILPDKLIGEMAGVSGENVRARRKRRDIPARWRGEGELLPNEATILEEAGLPPSPAPKKRATKKRKAAKPKAKKAPAKTRKPRVKKTKVEPVVEAIVEEPEVKAEPVVVEDAPVVEAEPAPEPIVEEPVVEAGPASGVELIGAPAPVVKAEPEPTPGPKASPKPTKTRKPRKGKLTPFLDQLGTVPDARIAEMADTTAQNVRAFRIRHGIPATWRDEAKSKAPKLAATSKASTKRKPRKGKLTPFMDQIGSTPDARIAEMAGTSHANVRAFRLRHDIPARWKGEGEPLPAAPAVAAPTPAPALAPATAKPGRKPRRGKLTPFMDEIGILSDSVIGEKAETTAQNVRAFRIRHGIPARWRGEGEPLPNEDAILALQAGPAAVVEPAPVVEAAPVAEPMPPVDDDLPPEADDVEAAAPVLVLKGYKVKVVAEDQKTTFVVTGANIVEAAQNAVAALAQCSTEGEVVELKFLAEMLRA